MSIISTDLVYGSFQKSIVDSYPEERDEFEKTLKNRFENQDMIDSEVGQFYYYCQKFDLSHDLEYIAIKGPSNSINAFEEMLDYSAEVMKNAINMSFELLEH